MGFAEGNKSVMLALTRQGIQHGVGAQEGRQMHVFGRAAIVAWHDQIGMPRTLAKPTTPDVSAGLMWWRRQIFYYNNDE
jgi:hypothetical protein